LAGRLQSEGTLSLGTVIYSFDSRSYQKLTDSGNNPVWLSDSRRLLVPDNDKLYLADRQSRKVKDILSLPRMTIGRPSISRDDRTIYFGAGTAEADIWMATLK
jgi:hypothetical protein